MKIKIKIINQLSDNYTYVIYNSKDKIALVVDPAESKPIIEYLQKNNLLLVGILITHHHSDHTSGIKDLLKINNVDVFTPNPKIYGTTKIVKNNDIVDLKFISLKTISTPGHTLDHVVYYSKKEKLLFSGDTLFYYGCGRIFEGTMKVMLNSLNEIIKLPNDTKVYCGHEYTYKNLEFIIEELLAWQDSDQIKLKFKEMIKKNGSSMPFYLGHQKDWNPFLNCENYNFKEEVANFHKNIGKISKDSSALDFFTFIRNKRNEF